MAGRVLLTGASSFTGLWIAEALAAAGFEVTAPLLRARDAYEGVRLDRVGRLERCARVTFERPFGSDAMIRDVREAGGLDLLAHHAAQITGYRDPDFDAAEAVRRNTAGASQVLEALGAAGGGVLLLTGSVFEAGEGGEGHAAPYVTPYGLSKTLTTQAFAAVAREAGVRFGRFVIPSPYGPFEERRFSWHLFRSWYAGKPPEVRTPLYVRDHLPAPLLARAYVEHVKALLGGREATARPSGWIAPQGEFGRKLAQEAEARLGIACPLALADQTVFDEPRVRVNDQPVDRSAWDEPAFWDDYVGWYAELHARGVLT